MKRIQSLVSGAVACGIALAMISSAAAQNVEQGVAKVVNIHGSARYMTTDNANWRPLKTGAIVKAGTVFQTAGNSYVDIVLNNPNASEAALSPAMAAPAATPASNAGGGNRPHPKVEQDAIRIFENTVLAIDKLTITQTGADRLTETQLDLKAGRIFGTVKKLSAGSKYEIKIPNGVAGIRGTIYFVSADGEVSVLSSLSDLSNMVPSGSLVLAYIGADGNVITKVVADGQHFDIRSGQITPISDSMYSDMIDWARQLGVGTAGGMFVELAVDHTVYHLSPSTAQGTGVGSGQGGQEEPPPPVEGGQQLGQIIIPH